jgi:hypothetical protein
VDAEERLRKAAESARHTYADAPLTPFRGRRKNLATVRAAIGVASVAVLVVAVGYVVTRSDKDPTVTPSFESTSTSTTTSQPEGTISSEAGPASSDVIEGFLPDGTPYLIRADSSMSTDVEEVSAPILFNENNGSWLSLGDSKLSKQDGESDMAFESGRLTVPAGSWLLEIEVDPEILASLGDETGAILTQAIHGREQQGLPVFELGEPLGFDNRSSLLIAVRYPGYVVTTGCDEDLDAICSQTRSVQVLPSPEGNNPVPESLRLESPAPRPSSDIYYLDPGPLGLRGGHSVFWTGDEMLVWGGSTTEGSGFLVDGAVFNPTTSTWQVLPDAPITPQLTVANWTGDELIVVGTADSVAWNPSSGWRPIAKPDLQISPETVTSWTDSALFVWTQTEFAQYDPRTNAWETLPAPPFQSSERSIQANGQQQILAAAFDEDSCSNLQATVWSGTEWLPIPPLDQEPSQQSCILPQTTAILDDRLFVWDVTGENTSAYALDRDDGWAAIADNPLDPCNAWVTPIVAESALVVFNLCDTDVATFDTLQGTWVETRSPGPIGDGQAIWTGSEILMWGATCCYGTGSPFDRIDAWRWTPEQLKN